MKDVKLISKKMENSVIVAALAMMAIADIIYFMTQPMPDALYLALAADAIVTIPLVWMIYVMSKKRKEIVS